MNYPIWLQPLKLFYENDDFYNDLTLPYLIGTSTIITPEKPLTIINELIIETRNLSLPHKIELRFYEFKEAFVIRIHETLNEYPLEGYEKVYDNSIITEESLAYLNLEEVIN